MNTNPEGLVIPMNRLPKWAVITIGVVLFLVAVMGITNSEHTVAKVVYAALVIASLAITTIGIRRPTMTDVHRESGTRDR